MYYRDEVIRYFNILVLKLDHAISGVGSAVSNKIHLKKATIRMYRILESGIEAEYFNIILENVKITTVSPYLGPGGMSSTHQETLELRYEAITWKYTESNIIYRDTWNQRVCA